MQNHQFYLGSFGMRETQENVEYTASSRPNILGGAV